MGKENTIAINDKGLRDIVNYLEMCYVGARALDDVEAMCRIERAIVVMKTPASQEIFRDGFMEEHIESEVEKALNSVMRPREHEPPKKKDFCS